MTNKDKVIAAFLVSVGVFSAAQAMVYVSKLSVNEKNALVSLTTNHPEQFAACDGSTAPGVIKQKA